MNQNDTTCLYLIRHATPDWDRTDIPYDIPPGPDLVYQGELESKELGEFIKQAKIKKLYYSPLERAKQTAKISSSMAGIAIEEEINIAEWRMNEDEPQFASRFIPAWNKVVKESLQLGPIGLVTHGGPIQFALKILGISNEEMESNRKLFDRGNPLPPAGVWMAEKTGGERDWHLNLVFVPKIATMK